jgi:AraC-like DNA-binding protein
VLEERLASQTADIDQAIQSAVEKTVAKAMMGAENQPLVSQADLDSIKQTTQQQFMQLQARLLKLKEAGLGIEPSQEKTETLDLLEQKIQTQIGVIGTKLATLFDFKTHQQAASSQQPLSGLQIQQWIISINTQWILQGRVEQTKQQLLALEQAITLSELPKATTLARLIGQDLTRLESLENSSSDQAAMNTQTLTQAILGLKLSRINTSDTSNKPENGVMKNGEKISVGEEISSESAWDQLIGRFGQMISLKKRESATEQTKVESLVMQDVLLQRALLLVDRIDWALQTQSASHLNLAIADLEGFIAAHFQVQQSHFETLLQPYKVQQFTLRQPLEILSLQSES